MSLIPSFCFETVGIFHSSCSIVRHSWEPSHSCFCLSAVNCYAAGGRVFLWPFQLQCSSRLLINMNDRRVREIFLCLAQWQILFSLLGKNIWFSQWASALASAGGHAAGLPLQHGEAAWSCGCGPVVGPCCRTQTYCTQIAFQPDSITSH